MADPLKTAEAMLDGGAEMFEYAQKCLLMAWMRGTWRIWNSGDRRSGKYAALAGDGLARDYAEEYAAGVILGGGWGGMRPPMRRPLF